MNPEGFSVSKCISSGGRAELSVAREAGTGRPVVLKSFRGSDAVNAAREEFDRLRKLAGPGIPEALDIDTEPREPFLVLSGFDSDPVLLSTLEAVDTGEWIDIASQLASTLRHLHARHWIHRDITPTNVLVAHDSYETRLTGLDLAMELGTGVSHAADGDPLYMAPEQFGRMGRGVDYRSDLYSLGATLYHLFTGRPPFTGDDTLELVHAHMAQRPAPPRELRHDIPEPLARLLLRLLEKEPDERYQSAHALHQDLLECQRLWAERGTLPDGLVLGASDAASRPLFSKRIYGREAESEALAQALSRVRAGSCELWLVRGAPGAGKSVLIEELRARSLDGGLLAQGKFDLYRRDTPYSGWTAAFEALAQQVLVRGQRAIDAWRERVDQALGANASVLVEWIPDWSFILGERPPAPKLEPRETQVRLARTTLRLLQAAARPDEPLILFLDDLQWADPGSRFLLHEIGREPGAPGLLLVGTYRAADIDAVHPMRAVLAALEHGPIPTHTLDVGPLDRDATLRMLADAFERSPDEDEVVELADLVLTKTENNPFLIQQFVDHMRSLGHIGFSTTTGWTWSLEAIAAAEISDDAVELIAARIERIEPHAREVLVFASFIGDEFDAEMLRALANRDRAAVEFALCALSESGLIVPCRAGFRFVHDRIREAAQSLRSDAERIRLHYDTASLQLDRTPRKDLPEAATELAEHFNRALELVPPEKCERVIQLDVWAAQRALQAGAPGTARVYADYAHVLVARGDAELDPKLVLELDLLRAETRILANEYREAESILVPWVERELDPVDLARIATLRIDLHILIARESESWRGESARHALDIGLDAFRKLGVTYPANPSALRALLATLRTYWSLRHLDTEDFLREAGVPDERQKAIIRIEAALAPIYFVQPFRGVYAGARRMLRFRQGELGGFLPAGIIGPGMVLLQALGWRAAAERSARIALELLERGFPAVRGAATGISVHFLVRAWLRHHSECARHIERLTHETLEAGDLLMVSAGAGVVATLRLQAQEPLPEIIRAFEAAEDFSQRACDPGYRASFHDGRRILECLAAPTLPEADAAPYVATARPVTESVRGLFWLILQDHARALATFQDSPQALGMPDHMTFHRALACASLIGTQHCPDEQRCRRQLRSDHRKLRQRARIAPDNFLHQRLLIDAECARLQGRTPAALELAQKSVQRARDASYPVDAALGLERVAQLLLDSNRRLEGTEKLSQALALYERWGAHAKVAQLRKLHGDRLAFYAERARAEYVKSPGRP